MSVKRPLTWGAVVFVIATAAGGVLLLRGQGVEADPNSFDTTRMDGGALACAEGEKHVLTTDDFIDRPGGPITPDQAMESWLATFTKEPLTLADVESLLLEDATRQIYEYRSERGPLMRFFVVFKGDSFHVGSWVGCTSAFDAIMKRPEIEDPPNIG